jgi:hypothetical protein
MSVPFPYVFKEIGPIVSEPSNQNRYADLGAVVPALGLADQAVAPEVDPLTVRPGFQGRDGDNGH